MIGVAQNITRRRLAEEASQRATQQYRLLADHVADVISLQDSQGIYLYLSPSIERLTGHPPESLMGKTMEVLIHEEDQQRWSEAFTSVGRGETVHLEYRIQHLNGTGLWVESILKAIDDTTQSKQTILGSTRDISRRKQLETQMQQAQKLEAIGRLAGGVAHDFNNLLMVINGCCELMLLEMPEEHPQRETLGSILRAGQRGSSLTRQLLAFSRQQLLKVELFDPTLVARDTITLLRRLIGENIQLVDALRPGLGLVQTDPGQFEQVLINLALNACDAMPSGGQLMVSIDRITFQVDQPRFAPRARKGKYLRLQVKDTGLGMSPEVQAHLFEPFFTTKPLGKGTGLGLATAHGIVEQSEGFILVESAPNRGTTVDVYWPHHSPTETPAGSLGAVPVWPSLPATILLVEDDATVQLVVSSTLESLGYQVITASSGTDGLRLSQERSIPLDLVLTDVVMPDMSGRELAEQLWKLQPHLKVIFMSGYTPDALLRQGVQQDEVTFLQKPFSRESLHRAIQSLQQRRINPTSTEKP
jgi:PAS domain S-box-containing protein